jgi:hypothetical protein
MRDIVIHKVIVQVKQNCHYVKSYKEWDMNLGENKVRIGPDIKTNFHEEMMLELRWRCEN